jgi:RimJ/RimL family protein N-acetyltransferase/predicted alpha/beta hydrolase family esterase
MGSYDMAGDLEFLRQHIGVETMSLIGHSQGGSIMLAYAEMFPHRVDKLILMAHVLLGFADRKFREEVDVDNYMRLEEMKPTSDQMFGAFMREFMPAYFYDPMNVEAFLKALESDPCAWCLERNLACDENIGSRQIDGLGKIEAEALIVTGRNDMVYSPRIAEATKEGIGERAQVVVFEECGHFPWVERQEEFLDLVLKFMKSTHAEPRLSRIASKTLATGDRPIGPVVDTTPAKRPPHMIVDGYSITLEPLNPRHADDLFEAVGGIERGALWDYMPDGPFADIRDFREYINKKSQSNDPLFFAVLDKRTGKVVGHASFLRIDPANRSIEVGFIMFSPVLQRTRAATECMFLMAHAVFEKLGYRRYEWKCNDLNKPSKQAAERLGFTFEGVFRQHMITKGRNRDTAWFSMLDSEWPEIKRGFERWLEPGNFDESGNQKMRLEDLRKNV